MDTRKQQLLREVVERYIQTGMPIASGDLAQVFSLSSATIRNEMAQLEKENYVYQPHVSAGRIPTAMGYIYYIDNLLHPFSLPARARRCLFKQESIIACMRSVSALSQSVVMYADRKGDIFYTGLSHIALFPDFFDRNLLGRLFHELDNLERLLQFIDHSFANGICGNVLIAIGNKNPIHDDCSLLATRYGHREQERKSIVALIGPLRMNYAYNLALLESLHELLFTSNA